MFPTAPLPSLPPLPPLYTDDRMPPAQAPAPLPPVALYEAPRRPYPAPAPAPVSAPVSTPVSTPASAPVSTPVYEALVAEWEAFGRHYPGADENHATEVLFLSPDLPFPYEALVRQG
ncbi:hypothetical protein ACTVZO_38600 [Streptomyces sp. IBSNAI002]|uniref:hypothetical protein n=1 Tax=Streptomyces sp. IBSNAI002 TaxID=3457500 RepID=UPI003FD31B72